jgi:Na+-driven multidrug efflux pump
MFERNSTLIDRKFKEYFVPTLFLSIALSAALLVSTITAGNLLGEKALSVISIASPIIYCINTLFYLFIIGGVVCASAAKGANKENEASKYFTLTIFGGMATMFLFAFLMIPSIPFIASLLAGKHQELASEIAAYLVPAMFIGPVMFIGLGLGQFIRADGYPKTAATIAVISNLINFIATYVFIKYTSLGIAGASWAMVFGYALGLLVLVPYLRSPLRSFRFVYIGKQDFRLFLPLFSFGLPKALNQGLNFLRTIILNALILAIFGPEGVAAMVICVNALMLTSSFISGTNDSLLPIVSTLYGAKDYNGIKYAMTGGFRILIISSLLFAVIFVLFPAEIGAMFGIRTQSGTDILIHALCLYAMSLPVYAVNIMCQNFFQSTGRAKFASQIAALDGFIFVIAFALLLAKIMPHQIWLCFVLSETATLLFIVTVIYRIRKRENLHSMLLLRDETEHCQLEISKEFSIDAKTELVPAFYEQTVSFCHQNGISDSAANRLGVIIEELVARTESQNTKKTPVHIDIVLKYHTDELTLILRDDGVQFNPVAVETNDTQTPIITDGIELVKKIASTIHYSRQLGFNTLIITLEDTKKFF